MSAATQRFYVGQEIVIRGLNGTEHEVVVIDASEARNEGYPRIYVEYQDGDCTWARVCDVVREV